MKPNDMTAENEKKRLKTIYYNKKIIYTKNKFNVGEIVRISKFKKVFEKGYTPNFTTELFKIINVNRKFPTSYHLKDMNQPPNSWKISRI